MGNIMIVYQHAVRKEQLMNRFSYQFRTETTQRLADARCGKRTFNIITKQPYTASQSEAIVQDTSKASSSSINDKPFNLDEFLRETEGKSYDYIQATMNVHYSNRKR